MYININDNLIVIKSYQELSIERDKKHPYNVLFKKK
jgi:hypothetical protein